MKTPNIKTETPNNNRFTKLIFIKNISFANYHRTALFENKYLISVDFFSGLFHNNKCDN